jgi:hypothetical protein
MEEAPINNLVRQIKDLQEQGSPMTLLAVCPNSEAVLEAATKVAASSTGSPMLFATTL